MNTNPKSVIPWYKIGGGAQEAGGTSAFLGIALSLLVVVASALVGSVTPGNR